MLAIICLECKQNKQGAEHDGKWEWVFKGQRFPPEIPRYCTCRSNSSYFNKKTAYWPQGGGGGGVRISSDGDGQMGTKITTQTKSLELPTKLQRVLGQKITPKKIPCQISEHYQFYFQKGLYFIRRAMWLGCTGTTHRALPQIFRGLQNQASQKILAKIKSGNWNPGIKNLNHKNSSILPITWNPEYPPPWDTDYTVLYYNSCIPQLLFAHPRRLKKLLTALHMAYRPHFQSQLLSNLLSSHQLAGVFLVNCQLFLSTKGYFHLSPWKTVELSECKELTAQLARNYW